MLSPSRRMIGTMAGSIPMTEIHAYTQLMAEVDTERFTRVIRALDTAFCEVLNARVTSGP